MRIFVALLLLPSCAATQEIKAMHRELSVQIGRLEEAIGREAKKTREERAKSFAESRKAIEDVREALGKASKALDQEIGLLRGKVTELSEAIGELKKGARVSGSSALADLEVRAVGENHYRVSRKQLAERTFELSRMLTQVHLVPHFDGDKRVGLRVVEVNGFLERFGILAGDVVMKVNSLPLTAGDQVRDVFRTAGEAKEMTIEIQRGTQMVVFKVSLAD